MSATRPFHERRRQQFLTENAYNEIAANQQDLIEGEYENLALAEAADDVANSNRFIFLEAFWAWMLDYTAGMPIEELAPRIAGLVDGFEAWNAANELWIKDIYARHPEDGAYFYRAAPEFDVLFDYEDTLQLLSIAILVRDQVSVKRIIHVLRSHRGEDGLFESLITPYVEDEQEVDTCVIDEPYDVLLQTYYLEDDRETIGAITSYLSQWYPAMKAHPRWYDGHLLIGQEGVAPYYGYWAFEAAAVVYMLDIDDSTIDHLVYPKDLVVYAKKLRETDRYTGPRPDGEPEVGRVAGGQPCPRAGFWFSPAQENSRRLFQQGELMPVFEQSSYGATIWQWSGEQ